MSGIKKREIKRTKTIKKDVPKKEKQIIKNKPEIVIDDFSKKELMDIIEYCFANNVNPLHYLAEHRNLPILKYLLNKYKSELLNVYDDERDTPLLAAIKYENYATVYE